ncbi:MAG TPA: nuclear transport factor 2 family protein [Micromonosporaceae bacterium]|nr:nuclear transport factor 2 family protein [Micromonosporaceae bacterium]
MDRHEVARWVAGYEQAWRSVGVSALADLFTADAVYRQGPYQDPVIGLPAIGAMWEQERSGPDEVFTMSSEIVAVEDQTAVVRVEVAYGRPTTDEWRDLWLIRFATDGRCEEFEEWPFAPPRRVAS